jgi:hypothetical protein
MVSALRDEGWEAALHLRLTREASKRSARAANGYWTGKFDLAHCA